MAASLATTAAAQESSLDIRLIDPHDPAVATLIARIGQSTTVIHRPDESIEDVILERCGTVQPAYVTVLRDLNPDLGEDEIGNTGADLSGRSVVYPACALAPVHEPVALTQTVFIERIYQDLQLAFAGSSLYGADASINLAGAAVQVGTTRTARGYEAVHNAALFTLNNVGVDTRRLEFGDFVSLPVSPRWTNISLRPEITMTEALASLALLREESASSFEAAPAITASLIAQADPGDGECSASPDWPVDWAAVRSVLTENHRLRGGPLVSATTVMVLDTGFDAEELQPSPFHPATLGALRPVGRMGPKRFVGVNLAMQRNDARPPWRLPNRSHGAEVASVLLGGPSLLGPAASQADRDLLRPYFSVVFASVAQSSHDTPFLSGRAIRDALREANDNEISILNISLTAIDERREFIRALEDEGRRLLLVVAAGNSGTQFERHTWSWPGGLGGSSTTVRNANVFTVGAHDRALQMLSFSRWGPWSVDILAPGCGIPVYSGAAEAEGYRVETIERAGTSFAAPLVSMTAAILEMENLSPPAIKSRLLVSADVDPALERLVYSSGRLNIPIALSVYQDVLRYRLDGREVLVRGSIVGSDAAVGFCGEEVLVDDLARFTVIRNGPYDEPSRVFGWRTSVDPDSVAVLPLGFCEASNLRTQDLLFHVEGEQQPRSLPLSDVIDLIRRAPLHVSGV
ncbi:S8 family serine peptidase [Brevundimonas sp.]|uniref:S8 family peptidase n=1 Tax=Brevundimonas sp. TaxID=1871086 RepID=UPI0025C5B91F|nr:S8 family serine peptidase [Brevundimonas sp.]